MLSLTEHAVQQLTSLPIGRGVCLFLGLALCGCQEDPDKDWYRFNTESDQLTVSVTAAADLGDPVSSTLRSTTGAVEIGEAVVDPGSGPVGTQHRIEITVDDSWEDVVGRVTVRTDAGERGIEQHELIQDSAEHGLWVVTVESVGAEGEVRDDVFNIELWSEEQTEVSSETDE